ncbi:putative copper fist DNA binding domain-containing protein [Rosellinia necatrix]|uniref:Putative copper fist DNA binding domain-containing protein n=1 Tax=Rosellinia necatrix TaxID=77044 RepID=A0A1W2TJF5_ROSNE|nr:putative copper fist DNA binding domain-containing protein [Rosellinia necatrix]
MLINGEKWACEACVRGHRVSNCQHSDRPLQHINKKGRPVSQCHHCRAMRKSRSSHVKCDCGEKTHKCAHLQPTVEGHKETCCCNHGGRCTCSVKKEPSLDPVPESESEAEPLAIRTKTAMNSRRRRANTSKSEPLLSFDQNGHHKPTHKHVRHGQNCGPYTLNRGATMHGTGTSSSTRSVDNLVHYGKTSGRSRTATASSSDLGARMIKSEAASPLMGGNSSFQQINGQLPPLDLSGIRYPEYTELFSSSALSDHEPAIFSAGLSTTSVDWTQYDGLEMNGGESLASGSFDPMRAYSSFDLAGSVEPTLTSNSGDVSEAEDFGTAFNDHPLDGFRNGAPGSYMSMPESIVTSSDMSNLDYDQFKGTAAASKFMSLATPLDDGGYMEDSYWGINNFNDGVSHSPDPITTAFWDGI